MNLTYQIESINNTDFKVINLKGTIMDRDEAKPLVEEIEKLIENKENNIILNLTELEYINSTGLNTFISILTKARNSGGELIITNVSEKIKQLLLITKLNTVFTVTDSVEDATQQLIKTIQE